MTEINYQKKFNKLLEVLESYEKEMVELHEHVRECYNGKSVFSMYYEPRYYDEIDTLKKQIETILRISGNNKNF